MDLQTQIILVGFGLGNITGVLVTLILWVRRHPNDFPESF